MKKNEIEGKTRQNAENKETFDLTTKLEIEEKRWTNFWFDSTRIESLDRLGQRSRAPYFQTYSSKRASNNKSTYLAEETQFLPTASMNFRPSVFRLRLGRPAGGR